MEFTEFGGFLTKNFFSLRSPRLCGESRFVCDSGRAARFCSEICSHVYSVDPA
jgi:hypothetical protein